jgi:hypothetical protein
MIEDWKRETNAQLRQMLKVTEKRDRVELIANLRRQGWTRERLIGAGYRCSNNLYAAAGKRLKEKDVR